MKNKRQRRGFSIWEIIGVFAIFMVGAAIVFPMMMRPHHPERKPSCLNNLKQVGIALMQYTNDYDDRFPLVSVSSKPNLVYGWADALQPYIKNTEVYQCPSDGHEGTDKPSANGYTDYWLNRNLAGLRERQLPFPQGTISSGDGNEGKNANARYAIAKIPASWRFMPKAPFSRHERDGVKGANYAFVDCHVKWLPPAQITNEPTANGKPTFAVK